MEQLMKQGLDKFAEPEQIVYRHRSALITRFIGAAYELLDRGETQLTAYNFPIAELYRHAIAGIHPNRNLTMKHIVLKVIPSCANKLMLTNVLYSSMTHEDRAQWYSDNGYCIEVNSESEDGTRFALMLAHLNRYFKNAMGIEGGYEILEIPCLALIRIVKEASICNSRFEKLGEQTDVIISGLKISEFVDVLNNSRGNHLAHLIVDETEDASVINIKVSASMQTVDAWNEVLESYNLKLVEVMRSLKLVVIKATQEGIKL